MPVVLLVAVVAALFASFSEAEHGRRAGGGSARRRRGSHIRKVYRSRGAGRAPVEESQAVERDAYSFENWGWGLV